MSKHGTPFQPVDLGINPMALVLANIAPHSKAAWLYGIWCLLDPGDDGPDLPLATNTAPYAFPCCIDPLERFTYFEDNQRRRHSIQTSSSCLTEKGVELMAHWEPTALNMQPRRPVRDYIAAELGKKQGGYDRERDSSSCRLDRGFVVRGRSPDTR
jgi:hypothetical protein